VTRVTALAGGVGGAKMLVGLARAAQPRNVTAVVNTGDDATLYGVHISPDVDIVTYWLAGLADTTRGWGIRDDTFGLVGSLRSLGVDAWFSLGDRDFATSIYRTERMRAGATLTTVTQEVCRSLKVATHVLPMTDEMVRTKIVADDGRVLDFQEYFVKERTRPEVAEIKIEADGARRPGPDVLSAIRGADMVLICPSNPLLSIDPILSLDGVREELSSHPNVVAVTPIVRGGALKGPADRLLKRLAGEASASAVARYYGDLIDAFVVDASDAEEVPKVRALGLRCLELDTIMRNHDSSELLARAILSA
jgi:LPPG:FO 2-phospho-L-lactate transferase